MQKQDTTKNKYLSRGSNRPMSASAAQLRPNDPLPSLAGGSGGGGGGSGGVRQSFSATDTSRNNRNNYNNNDDDRNNLESKVSVPNPTPPTPSASADIDWENAPLPVNWERRADKTTQKVSILFLDILSIILYVNFSTPDI